MLKFYFSKTTSNSSIQNQAETTDHDIHPNYIQILEMKNMYCNFFSASLTFQTKPQLCK